MQTKTYDELFALIQALCGVVFASTETPRIKALINRRALRAYRATNYWPRFLFIGEERPVVSGYVLFEDVNLEPVDTFLRIHKQAPWVTASVQEYDFMVDSSGAKLVCGDLNPSTAFVTYKAQLYNTYGNDGGNELAVVPAEWFQYLAHGTYADYLRAEGQQEKAALADQEAEGLLQDELIRIDEQHTLQMVANRIFTNANMQMRY